MTPLDMTEADTFNSAIVGHFQEALFKLAITCGLRLGELLALTWKDVDFERRTVTVGRTLHKPEPKTGLPLTGPTKNKKRRRIRLPAEVAEDLVQHRHRQLRDKLLAGTKWTEYNLVFPTKLGKAQWHNVIAKELKAIALVANLPPIKPHDLRHTAATIHMAIGTHIKVISEMLGHSNITITLQTYGHALPSMQDTAAANMDKFLTRNAVGVNVGVNSAEGDER